MTLTSLPSSYVAGGDGNAVPQYFAGYWPTQNTGQFHIIRSYEDTEALLQPSLSTKGLILPRYGIDSNRDLPP